MAASKPYNKGLAAIITTLIGPNIPAAYMAITGHAPVWARAWYLVWLTAGVLFIIARAASN